MKILLTDFGNVVNAKGGIEKVVVNMANAMVERGHDVTVMVFDRRNGQMFFPLDKRVKFFNAGVGIHICRVWTNITNAFVCSHDRREYRRYKQFCSDVTKIVKPFMDSIQPDVIIAHEFASLMVVKENLKLKVPVICVFHYDPRLVLKNRWLNSTYEKADCISVLLPNYVDIVESLIKPKKIVCIPNVVQQSDINCDYSATLIVNVARIERTVKRQKLLIDAFAKVSKQFPEWGVEFWGDISFDKEYYREMVKAIKKYGLEEKIVFCGVTENILDKLRKASIFAFPSHKEGFPLAMTEAMSIGLPVVAYKICNAVNQIVKDGINGILCEEGVDAFANGLEQLMSNENLRRKLGQQGKEDMKKYCPEKIWDKWEELMGLFVGGGSNVL